METSEKVQCSACPVCSDVSEQRAGGGGIERHNPLCKEVRSLRSRLSEVETVLVLAGLMKGNVS